MTTTIAMTSRDSNRPRAKTSSERGRKFRQHQREREAALVQHVVQIQEEVEALRRSRALQCESVVHTRSVPTGSCAKAIREFISLFQDGLAERPPSPVDNPFIESQIRFQENYMRYVFDPDAIVGEKRGVDASIDQWRRYTVLHDRFHLELGHIDVLGPEDNPTFHLHTQLTVRIAQRTFDHVFPSVLCDQALVDRFLHQLVTYDSVIQFRFSDDGRIIYYNVIVDFVGGLMKAGASIHQVASILHGSRISPGCMIHDDEPANVA